MENLHCLYLSLGSNLGNREQYLQRAIILIDNKIGKIKSLSKTYETASWGFIAPSFYNVCLRVNTLLSAQECLKKITQIEKKLGRERPYFTNQYQSRTIDIDILFYDNAIITDENLNVPHPKIAIRNFVLTPLNDIAKDFIHPILKQSIDHLHKNCTDEIYASIIDSKLFIPSPIDFQNRYNYIAIEGNIGAGKTTLATKISEDFSGKLILERFEDNPFLAKFYEDNHRYGFALEMSFLTDRYMQASEQLVQLDLFKNFTISDYDIFKSLIFARITLNEEEFALYRKIFYIMYKEIRKPDLYIYLIQNSEKLLKNIKKRGRAYEKTIPKTYLDNIQNSYLNFLQQNLMTNILFIDISELDFVENPDDYYFILSLINNHK